MSRIENMNYYDVFKQILDNQVAIMTALSVVVEPSAFKGEKGIRKELSKELMLLVLHTNGLLHDQGQDTGGAAGAEPEGP